MALVPRESRPEISRERLEAAVVALMRQLRDGVSVAECDATEVSLITNFVGQSVIWLPDKLARTRTLLIAKPAPTVTPTSLRRRAGAEDTISAPLAPARLHSEHRIELLSSSCAARWEIEGTCASSVYETLSELVELVQRRDVWVESVTLSLQPDQCVECTVRGRIGPLGVYDTLYEKRHDSDFPEQLCQFIVDTAA